MNRRSLVVALTLGAVASFSWPNTDALAQAKRGARAAKLDANTLADRVQAFYDKSKTFQSQFKQRYWIEAYKKYKDSNGVVTFQKPGKMSWRYKNNGNRVVSNGKIIKIYEQDNKQMFEQSMDKSQYPAALSFLVGGGNLRKQFRLKMIDGKAMGFEGGYVLMGLPKSPTPAYQKIFLYVDGATYQVRRVLLLDAQRNRNRFDFVRPVVNKPVPAAEFTFTPPPGTQVIKP